MEKKSKRSASKKKEDGNHFKIALISGLVGLLLGYLGHIGFLAYDNFYNRPKLNFKIQTLLLNEMQQDLWEMQLMLYQENTGNSEGLYKVDEIKVLFPIISEDPIIIKPNLSGVIKGRSFRNDTLRIPIPGFFQNIKLDHFKSFKSIELAYIELRNNKKYITKRDSTELELKGKLLKDDTEPASFKEFMTKDSKTGDSILIRGIHKILYKDKIYTNYFFPSNAIISHKIKDDRIFIEFSTNGDETGFLYYPAEELRDLIIFPNTATVIGSVEQKTPQGKQYKSFEFSKNLINGDMYFFTFKN
ncbi:MAG: hypothetical protein JXC36_08660 [Candidatus Atribacteria bacterium]|nr:hypothetical protein [Candidatus Atribacteria bacterium]